MRDIKFRAWDKTREEMHTDYGYFEVSSEGYWALIENLQGGEKNIVCGESNGVLMQFTGLLDKNGKDIYEGDIIDSTSQKYLRQNGDTKFYPNGRPTKIVKWNLNSYHNGWNIYDGRMSQHEVIGNIYENPELIEETK